MPMLSPLNAHQSQPKTLIHPHEQCSPAYAQWSRVMEYITLHWKASNQLKSLASKPAADPNLLRLLNSAVNKSQNDGETDQSFPLNGSKDILNSKLISDGTSIPWMHEDKVYSTGLQGLSEEIEDFYNYVAPIQEEKYMRNEIVNRLRQVATSLWPNAEVKVYGSFETGLYLPTSDIDVVIKCPDLEPLAALTLLEQSLIKQGDCDDVKVIRTSVPIVKFTDKNTATKVDVSINIEGALTSAEFIKEMMVTYPELKYLGFVLKQFLTSRGLLESFNGGISSYCLILLIISYLQLHPEDRPTNYGLQLIKFLELYGRHFNYLNCGIRVTDGGSYFRKGENSMGDKFSLLCVEDPFNADNDVGQSCFGAMKVREEFDRAFRELSDGVLPQYAHLQPPSTSLLARILNIAPEVVAYRRFVFERYRHHFNSPGVTLPYCLPQSGAVRSFVTSHVQQPQSVNHFGHHLPTNHQYQPAVYASGQGQQQQQQLGFNQLPASAAVPPLHLFQHQLPYQHLVANDGLQQSTFRYPHYAFPNYVITQPLSIDGIYPMQSLQVQQPYVEDRSDSDSLSSQHSSQSSQISQGNGNNFVCSNKNSNESEQEPETTGPNSSTLLPNEPPVTTVTPLVTATTTTTTYSNQSSSTVTSVIRTATVSSVDDRRGSRMDALCEITPTSKHSQNKSNNNNNHHHHHHHHHQNNHNHQHHHHDRYHQSNRSSGYQEDNNRSQYIHRTNSTKHNGSNNTKNFSSTVFFSRSSPPLDSSSSSRSSHQSRQGGNRSGANHRTQIVSASSSASPATSSHPVDSSPIQKSKTASVASPPPSSTPVVSASTQHHHHRNGPVNCQQNSSHKTTRKSHNNYSSNNFSRNSFRNQKNSPSSLSSSSSSSCSPTYSPPGITVSAVAR